MPLPVVVCGSASVAWAQREWNRAAVADGRSWTAAPPSGNQEREFFMKPFLDLSQRISGLVFAVVVAAMHWGPAHAGAPCGGEFDSWLAEFHRDAAAQGI